MKKNEKYNKDKITNERPISLSPLNFKEALVALLKIKPKSKEEKHNKKNKKSGK
jgi:hypothetical protein